MITGATPSTPGLKSVSEEPAMKNDLGNYLRVIRTLIVTTILVLNCALLHAAESVGTFTKVEGSVDLMRGGALPALPVNTGDQVRTGDFIRTKSNARAEVTFKDGNILKIAQRSRIDLAEYLAPGSGDSRKFNLPRGKVQAVVTKGYGAENKGSRFEIHTPNAVAGVRGTDFFVFHDRNVTGILVKEGSVYAFNPKVPQNVITVPAGTITTVTEKGAPQPPRPASEAEKQGAEKETTAKPKGESKTEKKSETETKASSTANSQSVTSPGAAQSPTGGGDAPTGSDGAAVSSAPSTTTGPPATPPATGATSAGGGTTTGPSSLVGNPILQPSFTQLPTMPVAPSISLPPVVTPSITETKPQQTLNPAVIPSVADFKFGAIWRDSTFTNNLLTVVPQGTIGGALSSPGGLWANTSAPFSILGINSGIGIRNDYWFGSVASKNTANSSITTYDGGTFFGYVGGADAYTSGVSSLNLAAMYVAPNGSAGLLTGSGGGSAAAGSWSGSGSTERVELNPNISIIPSAMATDWWANNTVQVPTNGLFVVTAQPPGSNLSDNNSEGYLVDASLVLQEKFKNRADSLKFATFKPDPTFGVWQRESWGSFSGTNSQAVLLTNFAQGVADANGHITPDYLSNIVSLGSWGPNSDIHGAAFGFSGDWAAGKAMLMGGSVSGSYNSILGTFGAVSNGVWLDVDRYIALSATQRQQLAFPGNQETTTFNLTGTNASGTSATLTAIRIFSNAPSDKVKLWATDSLGGTFSAASLQGEQVALSNGSGIRASFRMEHAGTSSNGNVWLAEINGLGELSGGGFSSTFNGVAAGTYSSGTFSGRAAGITHPLTYYSSISTLNYLKWFDGSTYQTNGSLSGLFGGMSLWGATVQENSSLEIVGLHTPATALVNRYVFSTDLISSDIPSGTLKTVDGGAYKGYLTGSYAATAVSMPQPIDGRVNALYINPAGRAGILTGKYTGYVDLNGIWEGHGDWYPVELPANLGVVDANNLNSLNVSTVTVPVNMAMSGMFTGGSPSGISTPASIAGNAWVMRQISTVNEWGVWQLATSGSFVDPSNDQWSYKLNVSDGSHILEGEVLGDKWSFGKLHGSTGGSWVNMGHTVPATGIFTGETIGTFDPTARTWQALAAGAWMETNTFLQMASTAAGQSKLQQLNIPAFEIGSVDFSGSGGVSVDTINVTMSGVKYFAPTAGGRPVIWATGSVAGTYTGNPVAVGNVNLSGSSATVSGMSPTLSMQSWSVGKWQALIGDNSGSGSVGGHAGLKMFGKGAGGFTGGTFTGSASGSVK